ncbi:MAG: transketolase C-terminal domain-containing protein [Angelakisella sp.]
MAIKGELIAIRDAYGSALEQLGARNDRVMVLEADVGGSTKSCIFGAKYPHRYFNVGISELNMTAMAAGFASSGMIPFVNTFSVFLTTRGADAIQSLAAYDKLNIKLAGTYCGLSDSYDGASHHAVTDMAFVRAIPNMTLVSVCDAVETAKAVEAIAEFEGPVYLRLSRAPAPVIYDDTMDFRIGRGILLRDGTDVTIVATGTMVQRALSAAELLQEQGISAQVVDIHTIKPLDCELLLSCAKKTGAVVTAEEHSIYGGLGSAVAELLSQQYPVRMGFVGVTEFAESGDYEALMEKYHMTDKDIAERCISTIQTKV